ncbi:MAG: HlyD family secretion protein [Hyphomonadaceae bacterium]|nr:HlyD family secretion protein [Hyphomonadaceae bacterium]
MPDGAGFQQSIASAKGRLGGMARKVGRRNLTMVAALGVGVAAAMFGFNWFVDGRFRVSTDNAYVRADISHISALVEGYVSAVPAADNQPVAVSDTLVVIEPSEYEARVAAARAALAQANGALAAERADSAWAAAEVRRYQPLAERGLLSPARMQQLRIQAQQAGGGAQAAVAGVAAARAQLQAAELDLAHTTIRAPIAGVIGDRQVQVGQLVRPGTPLMSIVPLQSVYVVANFKETQIERFRAGQRVTIRPDVADGLRLIGVVDSLAPASGTEFSIIPTDTATGNFTKIVQRVPVRIRLEPNQEGLGLLRPGLSVHVTVDTRP